MDQKNNIQVYKTPDELTTAIAEFIVKAAKEANEQKGRFAISLSGGHTPERLYGLLALPPYRDQVQWDKTFVFWGDERCVPSDDKQNNARMAKELLLNNIDIPAANIFPIPVDLQPAEAATAYEQTIKDFFNGVPEQFDVMLLGLGENGHTASLFPGTDVVFENSRLVKEVYVAEQSMYRITMTAKLINQSKNILFLLEGDGKAEILNTVLHTAYQPEKYPAQEIKPVAGNLYWFTDEAAAAQLPKQ